MICLLVLVQTFDIVRCNVARPLHIEVVVVTLYHVKARSFTSVDYSIVNVRGVWYLERHEQVLDLLSIVPANTVSRSLNVAVIRVGEKGGWRSIGENGLEEERLLGVGLEHTVGETGLFTLDKDLVQWIVLNEIFYLFYRINKGVCRCVICHLNWMVKLVHHKRVQYAWCALRLNLLGWVLTDKTIRLARIDALMRPNLVACLRSQWWWIRHLSSLVRSRLSWLW